MNGRNFYVQLFSDFVCWLLSLPRHVRRPCLFINALVYKFLGSRQKTAV